MAFGMTAQKIVYHVIKNCAPQEICELAPLHVSAVVRVGTDHINHESAVCCCACMNQPHSVYKCLCCCACMNQPHSVYKCLCCCTCMNQPHSVYKCLCCCAQRSYKRRRRKIRYSRPAGLDDRNQSVWATSSHAYFRKYMVADSIRI